MQKIDPSGKPVGKEKIQTITPEQEKQLRSGALEIEDIAESFLHVKPSVKQKISYNRAARPGNLESWVLKTLDQAVQRKTNP